MIDAWFEFGKWVHTTRLSIAVAGGIPWIWPLCETLHFMGMALLFGTVSVLDLRMLGMAKGLPVAPLQRLIPWGVAGFIVNLITGVLFFIGEPRHYIHNGVFYLKLVFMLMAGANVLIFYATGLARRVDPIGPGQDVPAGAKVVAAVSIFLWVGVMYWGRMLPFLGKFY